MTIALVSGAANTAAGAVEAVSTGAAVGPHFNSLMMDYSTHRVRYLTSNIITFDTKAS